MSALHRKAVSGGVPGLPPRMPMLPPKGAGAGRGSGSRHGPGPRKRSYSPVSWKRYWDNKHNVKTDRGEFVVYSKGEGETLVLLLHGGGYSGLTWSLFCEELVGLVTCRVAAMDLRGHGESCRGDDLSRDGLSEDVLAVGNQMLQDGGHDKLVLVGHSMGGAIAVSAGVKEGGLAGLVVIDVVEGTAMESLSHMQTFLRSRPQQFRSMEHAIEWCVRSGQVRNLDSAKVSMPGQIMNKDGMLGSRLVENSEQIDSDASAVESPVTSRLGSNLTAGTTQDSIAEEDEEDSSQQSTQASSESTPGTEGNRGTFSAPPAPVTSSPFRWAIDLTTTEPHWSGWFQELSANFLACSASKLLLLAGVDRLDKDLTVGQMQGKFQLMVLPQVGHAIHEDSPEKVAEAVAQFLVRNRLGESKDPSRVSAPRCPLLP